MVVLPNAAFSIRIGGPAERPESDLGFTFTPTVTESASAPVTK